jgi:hypothetical protein
VKRIYLIIGILVKCPGGLCSNIIFSKNKISEFKLSGKALLESKLINYRIFFKIKMWKLIVISQAIFGLYLLNMVFVDGVSNIFEKGFNAKSDTEIMKCG